MELRVEAKSQADGERPKETKALLKANGKGDEPTPAAGNPFEESFEEVEIVLDPYAAFETEMLRSAPQVINRLDRAFAGELHRCVQRVAGVKPKPVVAATAPEANMPTSEDLRGHGTQQAAAVATMAMPALRADAAPTPDLLVIEDDEEAVAAVIPGKQFRRLFSRLEAATSCEAWG
jgi:hypothetical protein